MISKEKINEDKTGNSITQHNPVLLQEVITKLDLSGGEIVFDGTLGGGGYSKEICKKIIPNGILITTDLDSLAINNAKKRLNKYKDIKKFFFQKNYSEIQEILNQLSIEKVDKIVLDLGISSDQLLKSNRGISFLKLDDDLDMNLSDNENQKKVTASWILNNYTEEELADIFYYYGGERASRKIALAIIKERKKNKFKKVFHLVQLIENEIGIFYKKKKIHPATKIFQALRIEVNDEIVHLKKILNISNKIIKSNGIFAVVTFHSLEDGVVKRIFRELENSGFAKRINKKVIKPSLEEIKRNSKARSAKLRLIKII